VAGVLGDWSYTYDAQNRLIRAVGGPSSVVAEFYYDARNRCVKRVINGVTTYLIYDGWSLLEERNLAGNLLAHYYHGPVIDELLCRVTETNTVYYHHDGLGSTVALTDSTGNVVESYTYDVYGQPSILSATYQLLPTSSVTNRFLFTGREYLADLALYDYRHRFYSPSLGRFMQTDPIRFEARDINLYRYVLGCPAALVDPSGLVILSEGVRKAGDLILKGLNAALALVNKGEEPPPEAVVPSPPSQMQSLPTRTVNTPPQPSRGTRLIRGLSGGYRLHTSVLAPLMMTLEQYAAQYGFGIDWTDWRLPIRLAQCSEITPQPPGCENWRCVCPGGYNIEWTSQDEWLVRSSTKPQVNCSLPSYDELRRRSGCGGGWI